MHDVNTQETKAQKSSTHKNKVQVLASLQPPFMDLQGDQSSGLAIDITKILFQRAGVDFEFRFVPPKRAYMTGLDEPQSCVLAVERSQEREALFQWVSPILITRHALYSSPDNPIPLRTLEDAKPYVIGSYLGSGVGEYLESWGFKVDYAGRNELSALKLEKHRIQLWASDTVSAGLLIQDLKMGIHEPGLVFLTTLQAMACHRDMPASQVRKLQKALIQMYRDGTIKGLYRGYQVGANDWLK